MKKQNGITLIALVITIIVLLILAGITINLTIGERGIITRAQDAGKNYVNSQEKEETGLEDFTNEMDKIVENVTGGGGPDNRLVSKITPADYGKTINYSSNGVDDWKVFYNDGNNVYIITSDYMENSKIDLEATGMSIKNKYTVYWNSNGLTEPNNKSVVSKLTNAENWKEFAKGKGAEYAIGGPTLEMYVASWNAKGYIPLYISQNNMGYFLGTTENPTSVAGVTISSDAGYSDILYYPHTSVFEDCCGYFLVAHGTTDTLVWCVNWVGYMYGSGFEEGINGLRPVVCLRNDATGTVGDTVTID